MRARLALEAGSMGSFAISLTRNLAAGDEHVCHLFGVQPSDVLRPIAVFLDRIHPEDRSRIDRALNDVRDAGGTYFEDFRVGQDNDWRWIVGRGRVVARDDGDIILVGINWDVTRRKEEEERLSILAQEMDHRVKNAFSVINALIRLGSRSAHSIGSFTDTLTAQLRAMADAHRMSSQTARLEHGDTVPMAQIARMAVAPWLTGDAGRVAIVEDTPAALPLDQVSAFAMLAYELATNAAKYGALGAAEGRLRVAIERSDEGETLFTWDEQVNPGLLHKANEERGKGSATGFGTALLTHCAATLKARFRRELRPEGLLVELRMPAEGG